MRQGIPMEQIDRMDILRYLDVMKYEANHKPDREQELDMDNLPDGTVEDVFKL